MAAVPIPISITKASAINDGALVWASKKNGTAAAAENNAPKI